MAMEKSKATLRTVFTVLLIELIDRVLYGFNYAIRQMHFLRHAVNVPQPPYRTIANSVARLTGVSPEDRYGSQNALNTLSSYALSSYYYDSHLVHPKAIRLGWA